MLGLFDCLGNRVAVYKDWRSARIGEAKQKEKLWALWESLPLEKMSRQDFVVYVIKPLDSRNCSQVNLLID